MIAQEFLAPYQPPHPGPLNEPLGGYLGCLGYLLPSILDLAQPRRSTYIAFHILALRRADHDAWCRYPEASASVYFVLRKPGILGETNGLRRGVLSVGTVDSETGTSYQQLEILMIAGAMQK